MINAFQDVLDSRELEEIHDLLSRSRCIGNDAAAGDRAKPIKENGQVAWQSDEACAAQKIVLNAIQRHNKIIRTCHPKEISTPLISTTSTGMAYGFHVDDAQIETAGPNNRSDISMTTFLCDPDEYEGGELEIMTPYGTTMFKLPAGHTIAYPSKFQHRVRTVTSGERLVAECWMQSHIRNEQDREILLELDQVNEKLHDLDADAPETDLCFKVYSNLKRRWLE